mgnify:CR=1 FL=1
MWEYLVVFLSDSKASDERAIDVHLDADTFTEKLNKYGAAGWELVAFEWADDGAKAAFKRQKAQ